MNSMHKTFYMNCDYWCILKYKLILYAPIHQTQNDISKFIKDILYAAYGKYLFSKSLWSN